MMFGYKGISMPLILYGVLKINCFNKKGYMFVKQVVDVVNDWILPCFVRMKKN